MQLIKVYESFDAKEQEALFHALRTMHSVGMLERMENLARDTVLGMARTCYESSELRNMSRSVAALQAVEEFTSGVRQILRDKMK